MRLEIIARDIEECQILNQCSNVHRIELCKNLAVGGFTPNYELIKECCKTSDLPIRVMVRNHADNFYCTANQFEQMKKDITFIKTTQAEGIVVGILTVKNEIDVLRMQELISLASPLKVTFHRAFDLIKDKIAAIKMLAQLKVATVLTQGGVNNVMNYLDLFDALRGYGVEVQIGSGVNLQNFQELSLHSDSIHVGRAVHDGNDWNGLLNKDKVLAFQVKS